MHERHRRTARRRAAAGLAALLLHLILIGLVGRTGHWRFASAPPSPPAIELALVPEAAEPLAISTRPSRPVRAVTAPGTASPAPEVAIAPAAKPVATVSTAPPAAAADADGESAAAVRSALRAALGCAGTMNLHLSREEEGRCDRQRVDFARNAARVDVLAPAKRRYYDSVAEAYADRQAPTPAHELAALGGRGPLDEVTPLGSTGPPVEHGTPVSRTIHVGCAPWLIPKSAAPPHALVVGPCVLLPPKGFLTEEADIRSPVDLRREGR